MSLRFASIKFGLSKSVLQRVVTGRLSPSRVGKVGRKTLLPPSVENSLVDFLIRVSDSYLSITPQQVKKIAGYYLFKEGKKEKDFEMSDSWFQDFMSRHKKRISSLKPRTISASRAEGFNEISLAQWYAFAGPIFAQYDPREIFNQDSAGIEVEKGAAKVRDNPRGAREGRARGDARGESGGAQGGARSGARGGARGQAARRGAACGAARRSQAQARAGGR